ncbi:MAG: hypothetical protein EOO07_09055 [Chitinophagaceae bacterium]|nr:MAG: hypothetical protein EOO07_09055 [Chitinophagaceae bacterium]
MNKLLTLLFIIIGFSSYSQKKLFCVYKDSASLVKDANDIVADFTAKVNSLRPVFDSQSVAILNTKPFLIFYSPKANKVNLPIWYQVIPSQKKFFFELAGGEKQGEELFGLFFNGFYLPHEMAHALQHAAKIKAPNLYQNEYMANEIAILYWRKVKRSKELQKCYEYAKKIVKALPSPVPEGEDPIKYFNEHYAELGSDPYKYGYYQFAQFVKIYDDKTLKGFDEYIQEYLLHTIKN